MKNSIYLSKFICCLAVLFGVSCSEDTVYEPLPKPDQEGIPIAFSSLQTTTDETMHYALYIFSALKQEGTNYKLDSVISHLTGSNRLKFSNQDLTQRKYRFLFTGYAESSTGITVGVAPALGAPTKGVKWEDIRLLPQGEKLSVDNYCQVLDMDGSDILTTDSIKATLNRVVGQMMFNFFKIGTNINDRQDIDTTHFTSIFDRIYRIKIVYEGYTSALSFDADGSVVAIPSASGKVLTQDITLDVDAQLGIPLPQSDLQILDGDVRKGGQIQGLCLLPNQQRLKTFITFYYYDTTPKCKDSHIHNISCYDLRTLDLYLPSQTAATGLSIKADAYTVNKAGIRCNRIIDIRTNSNIDLHTDWN